MSVYEICENKYNKKSIILRCDCTSDQHQLEFNYWLKDDWDNLFIGVTLIKSTFFKRLKYIFRYLFNFAKFGGAYEESIFTRDDVKDLVIFLNKYLECTKNEKN